MNHCSFTCDSETSVVVFDNNDKRDRNFARLLRMATWREFVWTQAPPSTLESWTAYATAVKQTSTEFAKITPYDKDSQDDLGVWIQSAPSLHEVPESHSRLEKANLVMSYNRNDSDALGTVKPLSIKSREEP